MRQHFKSVRFVPLPYWTTGLLKAWPGSPIRKTRADCPLAAIHRRLRSDRPLINEQHLQDSSSLTGLLQGLVPPSAATIQIHKPPVQDRLLCGDPPYLYLICPLYHDSPDNEQLHNGGNHQEGGISRKEY